MHLPISEMWKVCHGGYWCIGLAMPAMRDNSESPEIKHIHVSRTLKILLLQLLKNFSLTRAYPVAAMYDDAERACRQNMRNSMSVTTHRTRSCPGLFRSRYQPEWPKFRKKGHRRQLQVWALLQLEWQTWVSVSPLLFFPLRSQISFLTTSFSRRGTGSWIPCAISWLLNRVLKGQAI